MTDWHWYDTVIVIAVWSLIPLVHLLRLIGEIEWRKKFGERKPR